MLFAEIEKKLVQHTDWRIEHTEEMLEQLKQKQNANPSLANELMLRSLVSRLEKLKATVE
ncbi:MAG: hypothetical protein U0Y10_07040 [Spirosomataceae bacterium]